MHVAGRPGLGAATGSRAQLENRKEPATQVQSHEDVAV